LTLREEPRLRVFENRVLRRIFWPKGDEFTGECRKPHIKFSFTICTAQPLWAGDKIEKNEMGGARGTYGEESGLYKILMGNLRERDHWEDPGVDGGIIIRVIFRNWGIGIWTGLKWVVIETGGGRL
jgi:hypothetical protein